MPIFYVPGDHPSGPHPALDTIRDSLVQAVSDANRRVRPITYYDDNGWPFHHLEPPSHQLPPFEIVRIRQEANPRVIDYENDLYTVSVRQFPHGFYIKKSPYVILQIVNADQTARHDWREFQQIKNMLVGEEWVGLEMYPAESRLVDPSNAFYMWCVPKGIIGWGLEGTRTVLHPKDAVAPQRPFPVGQTEKEPS